MSLGPIFPGRIPNSLIARRLQVNLQTGSQVLARLQEQVASGRKFFLPGESPAAAVRSIVLQKSLERQSQWQTNIGTSRSLLGMTGTALAGVSDALNQAKAFTLAGIGDTAGDSERQAMAAEVGALLQSVLGSANTQHRGRYLFGGSQSRSMPFEMTAGGAVRYNGDGQAILSYTDAELLVANNVDGRTAFAAGTSPITRDVDPALALDTPLADLHGGQGVLPGSLVVTLDDGTTAQTQTVDLSAAETMGDVKTLLENAFAAGPVTLAVDIDPAGNFGLRLTPSAGTVAVADADGATTAADLGLTGGPAATLTGGDLDPRLTLQTSLSALNGGTGIGPTAGFGLHITNGDTTRVVDISAAVTVEDLMNQLRQSGLDLETAINEAGNGLAVTSRLSGVGLSIGENGGQNAALLGIRTFTGDTLLADLNGGFGVPVDDGVPLRITRRDGGTAEVDLGGAATVQDVLDRINAVDPGVLVAALGTIGNGIALTDNSGTGPLTVESNAVSDALGLSGSEAGTDPTVPLVGGDVHPQTAPGVFSLLTRLQQALLDGDDRALGQLAGQIDEEIERFNLVRGDVGSRLQLLERIDGRLKDADVELQASLALEFEPDITEVITQIASVQTTLDATLRIAAQTSQLTLLAYL